MSGLDDRMVAGRRIKLDVEQLADRVASALGTLDESSRGAATNEDRAEVAVACVLFELALALPSMGGTP
jgi:hypothetical protein